MITINTRPKINFLKSSLNFLLVWSVIVGCFYFNYKFIDGNDFLDFMIVVVSAIVLMGVVQNFSGYQKVYHRVSEKDIKRIKVILNKK
tara:strand:- start:867 stop:1130 length:264 start_codon:yes stop_codon:yes gene_type:complete